MGNVLKTLSLFLVFNWAYADSDISQEELVCAARTVYHEARGEPKEGQIAVVENILNRRKDSRWPHNLCDIVFQPKQYSWTHEVEGIERDREAYYKAMYIVKGVIQGRYESICSNNNHYHTYWVSPIWSKGKEPCIVGDHYFFFLGD